MPGGTGSVLVIVRIIVFLNFFFFFLTVLHLLYFCTLFFLLYGMFAEIKKDTYINRDNLGIRDNYFSP